MAQTRELECTKVVLPRVQARGLHITEVAHDIQGQVCVYVTKQLGLINSYDTWHGIKNVPREFKKIIEGRVRDKGRSIKIHLYWCMKNCGICPDTLHQETTLHGCHPTSPCHRPAYSPSKVQLTDPWTIWQLIAHLQATYVYRNPQAFCRCRDTYWVESFNHQLLIYLPKHIHFCTKTFLKRMNLAVMDWNENVHHTHTSQCKVRDLHRPDRWTATKVLVNKTFHFIDLLWTMYMYVDLNKCGLSDMNVDEETARSENDQVGESLLMPLESDDSDDDDE